MLNSFVIVVSIVSLFLYILQRVKEVDGEWTNDQENLCQKLRYNIRELLKDWVMCPDVIGGSFFGGNVCDGGKNTQKLRKGEQELEVR